MVPLRLFGRFLLSCSSYALTSIAGLPPPTITISRSRSRREGQTISQLFQATSSEITQKHPQLQGISRYSAKYLPSVYREDWDDGAGWLTVYV